ncbi:MAG: hypothetical protein KGY61_13625 [Desulfobacterales bacterium]|nr:hypothetical protein [Desulfobacterales bacterium]
MKKRLIAILVPILLVLPLIAGNAISADRMPPLPDIKVNGADKSLTVSKDETVRIAVSLDPRDFEGQKFDWWLVANTPFGWYSYQYPPAWVSGISAGLQEPVFNFSDFPIYNSSLPAKGEYTLYFGVDDRADGSLANPVYDSITLQCQQQDNSRFYGVFSVVVDIASCEHNEERFVFGDDKSQSDWSYYYIPQHTNSTSDSFSIPDGDYITRHIEISGDTMIVDIQGDAPGGTYGDWTAHMEYDFSNDYNSFSISGNSSDNDPHECQGNITGHGIRQ